MFDPDEKKAIKKVAFWLVPISFLLLVVIPVVMPMIPRCTKFAYGVTLCSNHPTPWLRESWYLDEDGNRLESVQ